MTKTNNWQIKGCICEVYFAYNTELEEYPQLSADINELDEMAVKYKMVEVEKILGGAP